MKRASWIVLLFLASFGGVAEADPVTATIGAFNDDGPGNPAGPFVLPFAIADTNVASVQLDLTYYGPLLFKTVEWQLDGVPVASTFNFFLGGAPGGTFTIGSSDPALFPLFTDGQAELVGVHIGGFGNLVGTSATLTVNTIAPIPEPGTVFLFLFGVVGAGAAARKKARAA